MCGVPESTGSECAWEWVCWSYILNSDRFVPYLEKSNSGSSVFFAKHVRNYWRDHGETRCCPGQGSSLFLRQTEYSSGLKIRNEVPMELGPEQLLKPGSNVFSAASTFSMQVVPSAPRGWYLC